LGLYQHRHYHQKRDDPRHDRGAQAKWPEGFCQRITPTNIKGGATYFEVLVTGRSIDDPYDPSVDQIIRAREAAEAVFGADQFWELQTVAADDYTLAAGEGSRQAASDPFVSAMGWLEMLTIPGLKGFDLRKLILPYELPELDVVEPARFRGRLGVLIQLVEINPVDSAPIDIGQDMKRLMTYYHSVWKSGRFPQEVGWTAPISRRNRLDF
jgi:hypothetical protein